MSDAVAASPEEPLFLVSVEDAREPLTGADAVLLLQARFVLRNLHKERPGCGYHKLAAACDRVAVHIALNASEDGEGES